MRLTSARIPLVADRNRSVHAMSKAQWQAVQEEGDAATRLMGE